MTLGQTCEKAESLCKTGQVIFRVVVFIQRSSIVEYKDRRNSHDTKLCVERMMLSAVHCI